MVFAQSFEQFSTNTALVDVRTEQSLTYAQLKERINVISSELGDAKQFIFIESDNSLQAVIYYLACLVCGHPVYLYDKEKAKHVQLLIQQYNPNIVIYPDRQEPLERRHDTLFDLHEDLALLLSTSGSTGTPKFVRLSEENILSNALSISEYLEIDEQQRALGHLKLHYSYGLSVLHSHIAVGAAFYITDYSVVDECFWNAVQKHNITSIAGVPYTFSSIDSMSVKLADYPSLDYFTQAGGKMQGTDVSRWAKMCDEHKMRFYVMYGQTEASPRISYLPYDMAQDYPDTIGVPVPGGSIRLVDTKGDDINEPDVQGELIYSGPNVMMGYAQSTQELAHGKEYTELRTGDIAVCNQKGLYQIVGRLSRFVKPYGVRVSLDDIETFVNAHHEGAVCTGNDKMIVLAHTQKHKGFEGFVDVTAKHFQLPRSIFTSLSCGKEIPRLSNGKVNYAQIKKRAGIDGQDYNPPKVPVATQLRRLCSLHFIRTFCSELLILLKLKKAHYHLVDIYRSMLRTDHVQEHDSFRTLGGDSLNYVGISLELETMFGYVPEDWDSKTIAQLNKELATVEQAA